MDAGIEFSQSAFKHGITEENIRYAFAHPIVDFPVAGEEEKNLLIGFDQNANVLEILYNVEGVQRINVFHAMKCRKIWRRSFVKG
ncbi:MAG: hypothetical protein LBL19_05630 [Spirochaetaceae bacterium]|jgi:hypothetical protein|nr:hypothetical protein [Spirochaetaceae bacterium]